MTKILIGDFLIWEKQDNGDTIFSYLDETVSKVSNRHIPIFNALFENTLKYDNYITINEITDIVHKQGYNISFETVKKAVQRIRDDERWKNAIESSRSGYRIRYRFYEEIVGTNSQLEDSDVKETDNAKAVSGQATVLETEQPELDSEPVENRPTRTKQYISNFIRDNERIRTYYYDSSLRDVSKVMLPVTLLNKDDNSSFEMTFEKLYESDSRYRYLVSGIVGSGKSLLARKLALDAARNYTEKGILPIYFNLENYKDTSKSLFDCLNQEYESYIPDDVPRSPQAIVHAIVPPSEFSEHCQRGSVLLLLDGLDAIEPDDKEMFDQQLKAFLRSYGKNTVVIFSRPTGRFSELDTFNVLTVNELTSKQVLTLIDMFIDPVQTDTSVFKAYVLEKHKLSLYSSRLYSNPLFVTMLTSEYGGFFLLEKPNIYEIVEKLVKYVTCEDQFLRFHRYSKTRMKIWELEEELCSLCSYLVYKNLDSFDASDVIDYQSYNYRNTYSITDLLDDLCRTYGLTKFVNGKYRFIDRLIVEYYYAKHLISNRNGIYGVWDSLSNCHAYSAYSIVSLMFEMDGETIRDYVFVPHMEGLYDSNDEKSYIRFLMSSFSTLSYYVGEGNYEVCNERLRDLDTLISRTYEIQQDMNNLKLPPVEGRSISAVFNISEDNAKEIGCQKGLIRGWPGILEKCESLNLKPVGYIYQLKVSRVLNEKSYSEIRNILLSDTFPLRVEFNKMVDLYNKLAQN